MENRDILRKYNSCAGRRKRKASAKKTKMVKGTRNRSKRWKKGEMRKKREQINVTCYYLAVTTKIIVCVTEEQKKNTVVRK